MTGYMLLTVRSFIQRFGQSAYRQLPRHAILRSGHRKAIKLQHVFDVFGEGPGH